MLVRVLGSGTSHGVPVLGCDCPVCSSDDPKNNRYRSSILIQSSSTILVDCGPDFRLQGLRAGIKRIDALLLTHCHADHLHGIDDLRPFSQSDPIPVYGRPECIAECRERFAYIWDGQGEGGGKPRLMTQGIAEGEFSVGQIRLRAIPLLHGSLPIYGYRIGSFAYITDCSKLGPGALEALEGLECLIIGALRARPHATHMSFSQALELAQGLGVRRCYLTHVCHEHSHEEIMGICRDFTRSRRIGLVAQAAYDGLDIEID